MTGVLYTTSGHDRCFELERMTGGARLEDSWALYLCASPHHPLVCAEGVSGGWVFR